MKISICLVLAFTCLMSAVTGQFNNGVPERQTRDRPRTYCGDELGEVLMLVCQPSRGKRHTMPEPSKQMSKYRPSIIDDEDKWAANWEPREDFYNRINSLRNLHKRSIIYGSGASDICCKYSCTKQQLREFCD
eukprot:03973.XXX_177355_177990_1 [CDS] Oithona nana genome sequencing.